jgi:serine/threonine protein kinase
LERKEGTSERLGRFELIAELASGGMATVFLARLSGVGGFQRFVAIKRLHPHLAGEHDFIQMFLDEARLAARLHHPNVVPILEIGAAEDGYYLVMEYIEGDTLARVMARSATAGTPLPPKVAVRVVIDALAGLHAAHELVDDDGNGLEIVHRDVSPQNILVGVDGSTRITDFGVARASTRLTTTRSGQLKGKLAYMAPEQARGKGVDRRADLFAMGIVLWEVLARKRLFKGEGEADTLNRVIHEAIPTLLDANPEAHAALDAVCMKALERDADRRYATARDFADALEKAATEASALGSHRDVQTHLDAIMGTDISQQRDAVRAWIARSEPSKQGDPRLDGPVPSRKPAVPSELMSLTKVETGRVARTPTSSGSLPSSKEVANEDATVSGVSSAVLAVPSAPTSGSAEVSTAASSVTAQRSGPTEVGRRRVSVWVTVLAVGLLAAAAFAVGRWRSDPPVATVPPVPPSATAVPSTPSAPSATVPAEPTNVAVAPSASVPTPVSSASVARIGTRPPRQPARPGTKLPPSAPSASASSPPVPDDISHNPYR